MNEQLYEAAKTGYGIFLRAVEKIGGLDVAKVVDVRLRFGKKLNLRDPQTLAEKVCYISIHTLPKLAGQCTDKWAVRDYVSSKGLEDILIPVCANAVTDPEDLDFDQLPNRFVLKAAHGCGMNLICTDKQKLDVGVAKQKMRQWLETTYGTYSVEPHYRSLPHRVYAEACIADPETLIDYKIHCLNGKPSFILVCSGREQGAVASAGVTMDLYDLDWNWIDGIQRYKNHCPGTGNIPRPEHLERMLQIAQILSADFDFVRVDLYDVNGKVYFGELTFTPANGVMPSYCQALHQSEGQKLKITGR